MKHELGSISVADPGRGKEGIAPPPGPVKISHKKDACQGRQHRFHVSCLPYPAAGSATDYKDPLCYLCLADILDTYTGGAGLNFFNDNIYRPHRVA